MNQHKSIIRQKGWRQLVGKFMLITNRYLRTNFIKHAPQRILDRWLVVSRKTALAPRTQELAFSVNVRLSSLACLYHAKAALLSALRTQILRNLLEAAYSLQISDNCFMVAIMD